MEEQWIREIQRKGSRTAADRLIRVHYDEIYRFVYRQTGHKEDAMDLTQSIFLAMLRALPAYRAERGTFRTWLYRIAANKVIDARRRSRLTPLPIEELEVPSEEDFTARIRDRALLEQIEDYVSGLEPQVQAVFRLRLHAEQSFPEIAAQWHPTLNGNLTPAMVTAGSRKKVWWICSEGHVWKAAIYSRGGKQKTGCPVCAGKVKLGARFPAIAAWAENPVNGN